MEARGFIHVSFTTAMLGTGGITDEEGRHTGYYWLSYFDQSLRAMGIYEFQAVPNDDLSSALQYDYVPVAEDIRVAKTESESSFANIYPVDHDLSITAIGTWAYAKDVEPLMGDYDVKLELYRLEEGATEPTDGVRIADQESHFRCAGYHRIELDNPVSLREGERIGIIATVLYDDGNGNAFYCSPAATFARKSVRKINSKCYDYALPKVNPGESFIHIRTAEEGEYKWIDLCHHECGYRIFDRHV